MGRDFEKPKNGFGLSFSTVVGAGPSSLKLDAEEDGLRVLDKGCGLGAERDAGLPSGAGKNGSGSRPRSGSEPSREILERVLGTAELLGVSAAASLKNLGLEAPVVARC